MEDLTLIFSYPFQAKELYTKRKTLKKLILEKKRHYQEIKIAVLGDSTTSQIVQFLELFLLKNNINPTFYESEYSRYKEEVLYDVGNLWDFNPNIIYIHSTYKGLREEYGFEITNNELYETHTKVLKEIWKRAFEKTNTIVIQNNFESPQFLPLSNLSSVQENGESFLISKLNNFISKEVQETPNLNLMDLNRIANEIGLNNWYDETLWTSYKFSYSYECCPPVANMFSSLISATRGNSKKCLVLDLDNTLWGGVIGDQGVSGIALGQGSPTGEAHHNFQKYLKKLHERGVILAICSKNDAKNAKEGFSHPESILKINMFSAFYANWDPKPENIKNIAKELNIGLDSIVFMDDNPAEREIVRTQLPEVSVPEIGDDPTMYVEILDRNKFFDLATLEKEDLLKNKYYKDNKKRESEKSNYNSYDDFLNSLNMKAVISPISNLNLDRVTQLLNKTNQFNLTTIRVSQNDMKDVSESKKCISLTATLSDKFGDNGLVSVIYGDLHYDCFEITNWVMSCRVFKRELEFAIFDSLIEECFKAGVKKITGKFIATPKNNVIVNLYKELGFARTDENYWELENIENYKQKNKHIEVQK